MGLAIASGAHAAPLTVPNTFTAGTPAKAAEVNANFSAVQSAVNANISEIDALKAQVDALAPSPSVAGKSLKLRRVADGQVFGQVQSATWSPSFRASVVTENGYWTDLTELPTTSGIPVLRSASLDGFISFSAANCSGEAFANSSVNADFLLSGGLGHAVDTLWVVAPGSTALTSAEAALVSISSRQYSYDGSCETLTTPAQLVGHSYRATPNIPSQTGIPTTFDINDYKLTFD